LKYNFLKQIPTYNNASWISETVDLSVKGHGKHNEHIVTFHDKITNEILVRILNEINLK
jgi:hypothetical protein